MGINPILALQGALGALTALFLAGWSAAVVAVRRGPAAPSPATEARFPTLIEIGIGAVTNFFDTLGIGSFATTTALFRVLRLVPDRIIPGTLNAGHTLPTVVQAFIYTTMVRVDVVTLVSLIAAAVLGRMARRRRGRVVAQAPRPDRDGHRPAGGRHAHVHDAAEPVPWWR